MKDQEIRQLSDEKLLEKEKKIMSNQKITQVLIGLLIGIAAYSTYNKGLGFFTFFPIFMVFMLIKNNSELKVIQHEIKNRKLK